MKKLGERINNAETQRNKTAQNRSGNGQKPHAPQSHRYLLATANTICEEVHAIDGKISQSTVYRNLNCLSEDGEILHIKVSGADRYDLRTDLHYHIICLKCGKVIDIPFNYLSDSDEKVANATGYTVFRHRAVFEGICPECKTENNI